MSEPFMIRRSAVDRRRGLRHNNNQEGLGLPPPDDDYGSSDARPRPRGLR